MKASNQSELAQKVAQNLDELNRITAEYCRHAMKEMEKNRTRQPWLAQEPDELERELSRGPRHAPCGLLILSFALLSVAAAGISPLVSIEFGAIAALLLVARITVNFQARDPSSRGSPDAPP